jgi:hypothetical protein
MGHKITRSFDKNTIFSGIAARRSCMDFPENAPFGFLGIMYEKRNNFRRFTVDSVGQEIKNWIIIFFVYSMLYCTW